MRSSLLIFCVTLFLQGCASATKREPSSEIPRTALTPVSVEVTYIRGGNSRRFLIVRTKDGAHIQEYLDRQLLKDVSVAGTKPDEIFTQSAMVYESMEKRTAKKSGVPCRTPFALRITHPESVGTVEGCRSSEEGLLIGKFLSDVEYLISSGHGSRKD